MHQAKNAWVSRQDPARSVTPCIHHASVTYVTVPNLKTPVGDVPTPRCASRYAAHEVLGRSPVIQPRSKPLKQLSGSQLKSSNNAVFPTVNLCKIRVGVAPPAPCKTSGKKTINRYLCEVVWSGTVLRSAWKRQWVHCVLFCLNLFNFVGSWIAERAIKKGDRFRINNSSSEFSFLVI